MKNALIFFCLLLLVSCQKENDPIIIRTSPPLWDTVTDSIINDLEVWRMPFNIENKTRSIHPVYFNNSIITSAKGTNQQEVIYCTDKTTGSIIWTWKDWVVGGNSGIVSQEIFVVDQKGYFTPGKGKEVYCIDLNTGKTVWVEHFEDGNPGFHVDKEKGIYAKPVTVDVLGTSLFVGSLETGKHTEVFHIESDSTEFNTTISNIKFFDLANGDRLLTFFDERWKADGNFFYSQADLHCINLTTGQELWNKIDLTPSDNSARAENIVEGDYLYTWGMHTLYKIHITTGEMIWERGLHHTFMFSNIILEGNQLLLSLDNGDLMSIDKNSGLVLWKNKDLSGGMSNILAYDGRIYFGNVDLFIVDLEDGSLIHRFENPMNDMYLNKVLVDVKKGRMYSSDLTNFYCWELPE